MMVDEIGNHRLTSNMTTCVVIVEQIQFHEIDTRHTKKERNPKMDNGNWVEMESPSSR